MRPETDAEQISACRALRDQATIVPYIMSAMVYQGNAFGLWDECVLDQFAPGDIVRFNSGPNVQPGPNMIAGSLSDYRYALITGGVYSHDNQTTLGIVTPEGRLWTVYRGVLGKKVGEEGPMPSLHRTRRKLTL